jgi:hypothetical protein
LLKNSRAFAERETRIAPSCPPDKLQPVKATMPKPETMTRQGKPVSVIARSLHIAEDEALKQGMEAKSKEFLEKGAEVYAKA